MKAETVSIVNDLKRVTVNQVVYEAITNSIQADATQIELSINSLNSDFDDVGNQYVSEIQVVDNGHGFKSDDLESFQTYRSRHKKARFGAKGVGRFLFLKIFENVHILSQDKEINFNIDNDVTISEINRISDKTKLRIYTPREGYQVNKLDLVQAIKLHFLPFFKLLNQNKTKKVITIRIKFDNADFASLKSDDIPWFEESEFSIDDQTFKLSYLLNTPGFNTGDGAYCAGGRVVCFNSQMDGNKRFKAFKGVNFFYLLSAQYFDSNLNNERDELTINAKRKNQRDWASTLSWEDINSALGDKIKEICLENGINIEEQSDQYLKKAIDKAPFLSSYFMKNELMLGEEDLLKEAQNLFNDDKARIRSENLKISSSERQIILNRVVQAELAEYVFDRQKIIEKLKSLEERDALESEIHNLFAERFTQSDTIDYKTNNLWLFDDRFMTYDKVFSDKQIKAIFPELHKYLDKPDILTLSSNTFKKEEITDVVIIELKRPNAKNDVAIAESELLKYSRYVRESNLSNIRIWTYAFISFDAEADLALDDKSYNRIPIRNGWPIRYSYHKVHNTIINFIDYRALAFDAESRNNTFLNILKAKHYKEKS